MRNTTSYSLIICYGLWLDLKFSRSSRLFSRWLFSDGEIAQWSAHGKLTFGGWQTIRARQRGKWESLRRSEMRADNKRLRNTRKFCIYNWQWIIQRRYGQWGGSRDRRNLRTNCVSNWFCFCGKKDKSRRFRELYHHAYAINRVDVDVHIPRILILGIAILIFKFWIFFFKLKFLIFNLQFSNLNFNLQSPNLAKLRIQPIWKFGKFSEFGNLENLEIKQFWKFSKFWN